MKIYTLEIEGVSPMLQNRFSDEAAGIATHGNKTAITSGERLSPHDDAESRLYAHPDTGESCVPAPNFLSCLVDAGTFIKAGKSKLSTRDKSIIPAAIAVGPDLILIKSKDGWNVDARPVVIAATKGRILRYRPIWNDWQLRLTLTVDDELLSKNVVRQLIEIGGSRVGLGDFRPYRRGPFGRFGIKLLEAA